MRYFFFLCWWIYLNVYFIFFFFYLNPFVFLIHIHNLCTFDENICLSSFFSLNGIIIHLLLSFIYHPPINIHHLNQNLIFIHIYLNVWNFITISIEVLHDRYNLVIHLKLILQKHLPILYQIIDYRNELN
jgi:hypothetical protein